MTEPGFITGLFAVMLGIFSLLTARHRAIEAERRLRSGKDTHFEERRELAAYPLLHDASAMRRMGWVIVAMGVILIAVSQA